MFADPLTGNRERPSFFLLRQCVCGTAWWHQCQEERTVSDSDRHPACFQQLRLWQHNEGQEIKKRDTESNYRKERGEGSSGYSSGILECGSPKEEKKGLGMFPHSFLPMLIWKRSWLGSMTKKENVILKSASRPFSVSTRVSRLHCRNIQISLLTSQYSWSDVTEGTLQSSYQTEAEHSKTIQQTKLNDIKMF